MVIQQLREPQARQVSFIPDYSDLSVLMQRFQKDLDKRCATAIQHLPQIQKNQAKHTIFEQNLPELTNQTPPKPKEEIFATDILLQNALVAEMFEQLYASDDSAPLIAYLAHIEQKFAGIDTAQAVAQAKTLVTALKTPEAQLAFTQLKDETIPEAHSATLIRSPNGQDPQEPPIKDDKTLNDENFVALCQEKTTPLTPLQQQRLEKIQATHKTYVMTVDNNGNRHLYKDVQGAMMGFEDNKTALQTQAQNNVTAAVGEKVKSDISPDMQNKKELVEQVVGRVFRFENSLTRRDLTDQELKKDGLDKENIAKLVSTSPKAALAPAA